MENMNSFFGVYSYPFGMLMPGRSEQAGDGYRYGFQGQEKDDEIKGEGNSYTTHFRQLDPRIGRWLSIDPKAGSMSWQSPYIAMDGNPILYNDILGDSITNTMKAKSSEQAMKAFLSTKDGYNEIAKFAKAGDELYGYKFTTDGEYHKDNINLILSDFSMGYKNQAVTFYSENDKSGVNVSVNLNSARNNAIQGWSALCESNMLKEYDTDPAKHKKIWNEYIGYKARTVTHEFFVHIEGSIAEFRKGGFNSMQMDGSIDHTNVGIVFSTGEAQLVNYGNGRYDVKIKQPSKNTLYWQIGYKIMREINQNYNIGGDIETLIQMSHGVVQFNF